jgi:hypothetical protein
MSMLVLCVVTPWLKIAAVCSSEILVSTYKFTWRHNPEDQLRHIHRCENLKSHTVMLMN